MHERDDRRQPVPVAVEDRSEAVPALLVDDAARRERVRLHQHADDREPERGLVAEQLRRRAHRAEQRVLRTRRPTGEQHAVEAEPDIASSHRMPNGRSASWRKVWCPAIVTRPPMGTIAEREERGEHRQVRREPEDRPVGGGGRRLFLEEQLDAVGQCSGAGRTDPARSGPMRFCMPAMTLRRNQMYISTESSSSTKTAIVLPITISTTVVSTPWSNSGSARAERSRSPGRLDAQLGDRGASTSTRSFGPTPARLCERHERGARRGGGVGAHRDGDRAARRS